MSKFITSFVDQLETVMNNGVTIYRCRRIERINEHSFRVGKTYYPSEDEAKRGIDASYEALSQSINRIK